MAAGVGDGGIPTVKLNTEPYPNSLKDFYKRLQEAMGFHKSTVPGETEFGFDNFGDNYRMLANPLDAYGKAENFGQKFIDKGGANQFWYQDNGAERDRATILAGVDPWLNRYKALFAAGNLSQADANALGDHYMRGVGVPAALQTGTRPQWLTDYIAAALRGIGATNV